jgi:hypothetical protein
MRNTGEAIDFWQRGKQTHHRREGGDAGDRWVLVIVWCQ